MGRRKGGGGNADDLPVAVLAHTSAGRIRLSFPDRKEQRSFFENVSDAVLRLPGVQQVEGRPRTGSLIINHQGTMDALLQAAHTEGVFVVLEAKPDSASSSDMPEWQSLLGMVIGDVATPSGAVRSTAIAALLAMVLLQASRGQIMPPATTALWYALSLLFSSDATPREGGGTGDE